MANAEMVIKVQTEYRIFFFPFAERVEIGDIVLVKVLGLSVYKQAGSFKCLLGFTWSSNAA
jgi:hypothetical protein